MPAPRPTLGPAGEVSTDLLAVVDPDGRLVEVNATFERVMGFKAADRPAAPWSDLLRPEDRPRALEAERAARESPGAPQTFRGLCPSSEGSVRWMNWRVLGTSSGHLLVGAQDVTAWMSAEHRTAEGEGLFHHLAENLKEVFWVTEPGPDPVRYVSPSYERVFGRRRDDLYARPRLWIEAVHPEDRPRVRKAVREKEQSGGYDEVYRIVRPDGEVRWIRDRAFPVRDASGRVLRVFGLAEDVSALRHAESSLQQAASRLQESQRLEAIGRLAGSVAHDFNNLLTVIVGYGDLLLGRIPYEDPCRKMIETMKKTGERAAAMTRQLLAFSRSQVLQPRILDLRAVVSDLEPVLRRLLGEDVDLAVIAAREVGNVRADPSQVGQVVLNLVANARDAMPLGGKLTIEVRQVELDDLYCRTHPDVKPGTFALLAVSDTGVGMDAATKARMFEPFFTTKEAGRGTGLGLATVYGIVRQSAGHLEVYSELGHGTTVKAYLPVVPEPLSTPSTDEPAHARRGTESVLLAEDEESVRVFASQVLREHGYCVLSAESGTQALRILRERKERVDVLVTDIVMPEMGGRELWEKVKDLHPSLRVIFMSGYTDDAILRHGIVARDVGILEKPFTAGTLLRRIRSVLDGPRAT